MGIVRDLYMARKMSAGVNIPAPSVAQYIKRRRLAGAGSAEYEGDIVEFDTLSAKKLKELSILLSPVQDLNGYDAPWPAGGGKNILDPDSVIDENKYIDSSYGTEVTPQSASQWRCTGYIPVDANADYYFGQVNASASVAGTAFYDESKTFIYQSGVSATALASAGNVLTVPAGAAYVRHSFRVDEGYNADWENSVYITRNSNPHVFSPYSNLCPITGRTGAGAYLGTEHDPDTATLFSVDWTDDAGTVYSGTVDIVTGVLTVDMANAIVPIDSVTNPGGTSWFAFTAPSAVDINVAPLSNYYVGKTYATNTDMSVFPNNVENSKTIYIKDSRYSGDLAGFKAFYNAQAEALAVCYGLAAHVPIQLTPQEIQTLIGHNVIWSPDGPVKVRV